MCVCVWAGSSGQLFFFIFFGRGAAAVWLGAVSEAAAGGRPPPAGPAADLGPGGAGQGGLHTEGGLSGGDRPGANGNRQSCPSLSPAPGRRPSCQRKGVSTYLRFAIDVSNAHSDPPYPTLPYPTLPCRKKRLCRSRSGPATGRRCRCPSRCPGCSPAACCP